MTVTASAPDRRPRPSVAPIERSRGPDEPEAGSDPRERGHPRRRRRSLEGETNPRKELVPRVWQRPRGTRTRRWSKTLESAGTWTERHEPEDGGTTRSARILVMRVGAEGHHGPGHGHVERRARSPGSAAHRAIERRGEVAVDGAERRRADRDRGSVGIVARRPRGIEPHRATGETTRSRTLAARGTGQPGPRGGGAPEVTPPESRWDRKKRRTRRAGTSRSSPSRREAGSEGSDGAPSTAVTNDRRGAGRSDAVRLPARRKPSQGFTPVGNPVPSREASASTNDPGETWRTRTRYRLQHVGSRRTEEAAEVERNHEGGT